MRTINQQVVNTSDTYDNAVNGGKLRVLNFNHLELIIHYTATLILNKLTFPNTHDFAAQLMILRFFVV